jgi:hypothetical protein
MSQRAEQGAMTEPQVPGLTKGARTEFTVFGDVIPGHEDELRQNLKEIEASPRSQDAVKEIGTLHESRFVLMDGGKRLMFCSSFDGTWDQYIDDFATTGVAKNFELTWSHCQGFPGIKDPNAKDWFKAHAVKASQFVVAYPEPTVKQVWRALAVAAAFDQVLDNPDAAEALQQPALKPLLDLAEE